MSEEAEVPEDSDEEVVILIDDGHLEHIGILRKSGRYPWGSGETPHQRNKAFLDYVEDLRKKGLTETQIAEGMGMFSEDGRKVSTTALRAAKSIAKNEIKKEEISQAMRLKEKGLSNIAIGERMGMPESSVRALLNPSTKERADILQTTSSMLKDAVTEKGFIDVGVGVENHLGISSTKLATSVAMLREQGYELYYLNVQQLGTGKDTKLKVLGPPGATYQDLLKAKSEDKIGSVGHFSEDNGRSFLGMQPPLSINSKRVAVRYGDEGGADADGLIQVRRGVDDVSLGGARYAQVRIAVDGTHYLKGVAAYSDNMPDGVDIVFNTNKKSTGNKLDAMKKVKDDPENPFGTTVRQKIEFDSKGKPKVTNVHNIVNEEGDWDKWSSKLSSQFLSKQSKQLAQEQLGLSYDIRKAEFDEIMSLTNPAVKKKLLNSFADGADSAADHLKATGLPRTKTKVILPINTLKDTEIYAPTFRDGEKVVLVRHPHGGIFEIPELTVNNRNKLAKSVMQNAVDAVGINSKVAARLSGADFDGDTVLVIPNNSKKVRNAPPLQGLKDFDPQRSYPAYEGMKPMSARTKQLEMGKVSNLITDMTIRGANSTELAAAVRHSMVVIDAEKHNLNYRQSAKDNGISALKAKYQNGSRNGATTLISQASSEVRIDKRKDRHVKNGGPIDAVTGKRMYEPTGESYVNKFGKTVVPGMKVSKMSLTDDAHSLSSGQPIERVYADHANKLKALGNNARKAMISTPDDKKQPSAVIAYAGEVSTLRAKLNVALKNAPIERRAQLLANANVAAKKAANPGMDNAELKKVRGQALAQARLRTGAAKTMIDVTPREWEAIQAGAISTNQLKQILDNTDLDVIKAYATPRAKTVMIPSKMAKAQSMLNAGYTQSEIADALGVPTSTLASALA